MLPVIMEVPCAHQPSAAAPALGPGIAVSNPSPCTAEPALPAEASDIAIASSSAGSFRLTHLASLDGLRGLACLLVVGFHLGVPGGGYIGVDVFFVLSGFLITTLLLQEWDRTSGIDLKRFFLRRAVRLMPALMAMFAVCWIVALIFLPAEQSVKYIKAAIVNLLFQGNRLDLIGPNIVPAYMHTWSLAVEDKFYLLWPMVLCAGLAQKFDRRWLLVLPVLGIASSATTRAWLSWHGPGGPGNPELYFGLENRADALLAGCLVGMLAIWNVLPAGRWFRIALRWSATVSWLVLICVYCFATHQAPYLFRGVFTLIAVTTSLCILSMAIAPIAWVTWLLELRVLTSVGRLSYGVYLWHWPIMHVMVYRPPMPGISWYTAKALTIPMSLAVAALSYYCLERPLMRLVARPAVGVEAAGTLHENTRGAVIKDHVIEDQEQGKTILGASLI